MTMSIRPTDGSTALGVGHDVDVNGITGTIERIDPDGKVTVALASGPTVSGYPAGQPGRQPVAGVAGFPDYDGKAWPPAGIETK